MKRVLKHITTFLPPLLLVLIILIIPQLDNLELMNHTQSSKAFGFIGATLVYMMIGLFIAVLKQRILSIGITIVDLLLGLYSLMVLVSYWLHPIDYLQMLTFVALILFYLSIRFLDHQFYILLLFSVVILGLIQAIYGNMQLYGFSPSNHGIFKMTGSFFNPGPYAGFLAAIFAVSLGLYLFKHYLNIPDNYDLGLRISLFSNKISGFLNRIPFISHLFYNITMGVNTAEKQGKRTSHIPDTMINSLLLISTVSMCLVLPASRSRAAWLATLVSIGYLLSVKYNLLSYIRSAFNTVKKKFLLITSAVIIFAITGAGLYYFKKDSADGRLLIWKVSVGMIKDKPIFGHGNDKFAVDYMNYQAAYFKPNPDVPEAMQADNVTYAYNEFLKLTVEKGLFGLLLGLGVIWCLFFEKSEEGRRQKLKNPILLAARGGLLSVLVFALFSYPSDILPINMLFVLFAAIVATHQSPIKLFQLPTQKTDFASKVVGYAALAIVLITVYPTAQYLTRQYQAYKTWKDASDIYNVGAYIECLEDFELAYPQLKTNGVFLVQYGKALEMAEKHENSITILNEPKPHLNNTVLYTCLGNNYKALGKHAEAEQAYLHAFNMAPAKFFPLYLLAKLYDETGQKEKAVAMANKVMGKEVKIESTAIKEIQEEMKKIIEKSDAEMLNRSNIHTDKNLTPIYNGTKEGAYRSVVLTAKFMLQKW